MGYFDLTRYVAFRTTSIVLIPITNSDNIIIRHIKLVDTVAYNAFGYEPSEPSVLIILRVGINTRDKQPKLQTISPRARGVLFVLKGPYDPRVPPIVKFTQESESACLTKIILSKSTVKNPLNTSTVKIANRNLKYWV